MVAQYFYFAPSFVLKLRSLYYLIVVQFSRIIRHRLFRGDLMIIPRASTLVNPFFELFSSFFEVFLSCVAAPLRGPLYIIILIKACQGVFEIFFAF